MSHGTDSQSGSQYLSSSQSSLHGSKKASSEISKTYKHASQLYLTRRLAEAYEALQSVIKPLVQQNGHDEADGPVLAPIATASASQRIKTWSLFAALLNAAIDLGSDEGAREFGQKQYREILKLVQNGDVWEQVVQNGYRGREDSVDAEVVYNLSTLLLGKAQDQSVNQSRLETYLSSSPHTVDLSDVSASLRNGHRATMNGTSTPKDLSSRIKIIELFTLHVLPANNEWDYAHSFVSNSDILDDERREAFLQTLSELQEAKEQEDVLEDTTDYGTEDDEPSPQEEPMDETPIPTPSKQNGHHRGHHRTSSEVDYGIESEHPNGIPPSSTSHASTETTPRPLTSLPPKPEPTPTPSSTPANHGTPTRPQHQHLPPPSATPSRRNQHQPSRRSSKSQPSSQTRTFLTALSNLTRNLGGVLMGNSTAVFRLLIFLLAFFMAFSRREVRERVQLLVGKGWEKMRRTVGMGVKVSYI